MMMPGLPRSLTLTSAVVPPSDGVLSTGRSGWPPHPTENTPAPDTSATNASDRFTHENLVIMVLTANKDSPKSQTGFAAGSLEYFDHSYFVGAPMCRRLCAKSIAGDDYPDVAHNVAGCAGRGTFISKKSRPSRPIESPIDVARAAPVKQARGARHSLAAEDGAEGAPLPPKVDLSRRRSQSPLKRLPVP
jgi:hypothetical protein